MARASSEFLVAACGSGVASSGLFRGSVGHGTLAVLGHITADTLHFALRALRRVSQRLSGKFDGLIARAQGAASIRSVARDGGVWDTFGNWFCVTGGQPVFQRLQTPSWIAVRSGGIARTRE